MAETNLRKIIHYSNQGIMSKVIAKTDKYNVTLFSMSKGTEISEHTSTKEGIVYVMEGEGIFELESKQIKMSPGEIIFMRNNAAHSLMATENTSFLLVLIK